MYPLRPPTPEVTRSAIDNMLISSERHEIYQNAYRYMYIIAGRLREVYGEYSPKGRDAFYTLIDGEEALIFPVKTARRNGVIRSVAVPFESEAWASILYEFFLENEDGNPFNIGETDATSRKYLQTEIEDVCTGHEWSRPEYKRRHLSNATDNQIIDTTTEDGITWYLLEYPNRERYWKNKPIIVARTIEEEKWRDFTCMHLREQRIVELRTRFNFSDIQIKTYAGLWQRTTRRTTVIEWDNIEPITDRILEPLKELSAVYFSNFF